MTNPRIQVPPELEKALASEPAATSLRAVWHELPDPAIEPLTAAAHEAAWQRLMTTIAERERAPALVLHRAPTAAPRFIAPRFAMRRWRMAAALFAMLAGGAGVGRLVPVTLRAPAGQQASTFTLSDGSTLALAPGSRARVSRWMQLPAPWGPRLRQVELEGDGHFAVTRNTRAFEVVTGDATVRVLGTRFFVRAGDAAPKRSDPIPVRGSRVAVEEGVVQVQATGSSSAVRLTAGEQASVRGNIAARDLAADIRFTSWRSGGLAAVDEPLSSVLTELARRYGVSIALDNDVDGRTPVTLLYVAAPTVEVVLADLATARALSYRRTSRGYVVSRISDAR